MLSITPPYLFKLFYSFCNQLKGTCYLRDVKRIFLDSNSQRDWLVFTHVSIIILFFIYPSCFLHGVAFLDPELSSSFRCCGTHLQCLTVDPAEFTYTAVTSGHLDSQYLSRQSRVSMDSREPNVDLTLLLLYGMIKEKSKPTKVKLRNGKERTFFYA